MAYRSPIFDDLEIVRWIVVAPIVAGMAFGLITLFLTIFTRNV
jgi:hypothetical protein